MNRSMIVTCPNCKMRVLPKADGTCPSCQSIISQKGLRTSAKTSPVETNHVIHAPKAQGSLHERHNMNSKNLTTGRIKTDEYILLVIHDAVQQSLLGYTIGDIILTDHCFYFIQYDQITEPNLMFGLVGGIISVLTENKRIASLQKDADRIRRGLYGLGLSKRIALKGPNIKSMALTPADVKRLHAGNGTQLSLTARDRKQYYYLVPAMDAAHQEVVNHWPKSQALYDSSRDPDGFFVSSSSPRELLLRIANGDIGAASEIYQLGLRENYAVVLFANLQYLNDNERSKVFSKFSGAPVEFRNAVLAHANKVARDSKKNITIGVILILVFGFLGVVAISSLSIGTGIPALIGIVLGLSAFVNSTRSLRVANEAKTDLKGMP